MDAHPVPQNVTQFQFKLIGDMTLKQFFYAGGGFVFAYLIFVFLSGTAPLISWPIIIISSFLGIAFAFLPIADRPLDHWVAAFLKAIYSPTTRIWKKNGKSYKEDATFKNRLNIYLTVQKAMAQPLLSSLPHPSGSAQNLPQFKSVATPTTSAAPFQVSSQTMPAPAQPASQAQPQSSPMPAMPSSTSRVLPSTTPAAQGVPNVEMASPLSKEASLPSADELSQTVNLGRQAQALQVKIIESEKELRRIKGEAAKGAVNPAEYTKLFNSVFEQLQQLVKEASEIKRQLDMLTRQPQVQKPQVKVEVVKPRATPTPIVLTSTPNVISGIVVDAGGNYLEGVVVVVHDKDNLPVRALKTNKLGQFTGSTPLSKGTFNIELEKDGYVFDVQQVELKGEVMPPMMVSAKTAMATA